MLRGKCKVTPKSDKAKEIFANYLNSKSLVYIEHKRPDRWIFSAIDNVDFWFWVDYPNDNNWDYYEVE